MKPQLKRGRGIDKPYLAWLKTLPCYGCGRQPTDDIPSIPAHQRCLGGGGMGMKPPDKEAVPLCHECHEEEHRGAVIFWHKRGLNPAGIVLKLVKLYEEK